MSTTRLFIECPTHQKYLAKQGLSKYSNGAFIEKVAGARSGDGFCPCGPNAPYKFRLEEKTRVQVLSDDSELTHFLLRRKTQT